MINNKATKKIFTAVIILFPILNSAHIGNRNFGYGDAVLVLVYVLMLFTRGRPLKFSFQKESIPFVIFLLYLGSISLINCILVPQFGFVSMLNPFMRYSFYGIILFTNKSFFDYEFGVSFYVNVCLAETLYGFIQFVLTFTNGTILPYVFPFTTMEYGIYGADYNKQLLHIFQEIDGIRLVGFFPEASHFAQYTIISVVILLYKKNKKRGDLVKLILISIAIILTKSSVGILALVFVSAYYIMTDKYVNSNKIFFRIILVIVGGILLIIINNHLEIVGFIQERIRRISEKTYAVSGNLRLLRGFIVFSKAPLRFEIFGIGCGNYANFVETYDINTFFDLTMNRTNEYMNAASLLMIRSGLIGTMIYMLSSFVLFININKIHRVIFFIWMELFFTENIFFSPMYVLFMWFIVAGVRKNNRGYIAVRGGKTNDN